MTRERERCNMCAGSTAHMSCDQFFSPIITPDIPRCMLKMLSDVVRSRSHCILCHLSRVSNSIKRYSKGMTKMYTLLQEHCESDNMLTRGDPHVVFLFIYAHVLRRQTSSSHAFCGDSVKNKKTLRPESWIFRKYSTISRSEGFHYEIGRMVVWQNGYDMVYWSNESNGLLRLLSIDRIKRFW